MNTAVALIIFNRPEATQRVFDAIRKAQPPKLFVVADGPREGHSEDKQNCLRSRAIIDQVDWKCQVIKDFSEKNLGAGVRPFTGISKVFEQVDEAIILEDDCLPNQSFFKFCEILLERYREEERVMTICGTNVIGEWKSDQQSYLYSYLGNVWGWASWKRAWQHYDYDMKLWENSNVKERVKETLNNDMIFHNRQKEFDAVHSQELSSAWDHQWLFARLSKGGLSITSSVNLVSNIGFSQSATHTKNADDVRANLPTHEIEFPLTPPPTGIRADSEFDKRRFEELCKSSLLSKLKDVAHKLIHHLKHTAQDLY